MELSTGTVEPAALQWNRDKAHLNLKVLETDLGESLNVMSKRTTEGSFMISKQLEAEVTQGSKPILAEFKYEIAKIFGVLNTFLPESTLGVQRETANCVAMLFNPLESVREACSVMFSALE